MLKLQELVVSPNRCCTGIDAAAVVPPGLSPPTHQPLPAPIHCPAYTALVARRCRSGSALSPSSLTPSSSLGSAAATTVHAQAAASASPCLVLPEKLPGATPARVAASSPTPER
ncbi:hypothetical protein SASPL_136108 [Salvia splendens]|uniref:Uncharacterized protein n=1 Tax=Salvia splendens TaxID=180675 RepID=A0A8X8ZH77_SALSN|nr:hypothetical protein SASPL_136108 [Salvia splendens]